MKILVVGGRRPRARALLAARPRPRRRPCRLRARQRGHRPTVRRPFQWIRPTPTPCWRWRAGAHRPDRRRPRGAPGRRDRRPLQCSRPADLRSHAGPRRSSRPARRSRRSSCSVTGVPTARYRVCATADEALAAVRRGEFGDAAGGQGRRPGRGQGRRRRRDRAPRPRRRSGPRWSIARSATPVARSSSRSASSAEVSFFVIADGEHVVPLVAAQDHKRHLRRRSRPQHRRDGRLRPERPLLTTRCAIAS